MISAAAGLVKEWILLYWIKYYLPYILIEKFREDEFIELLAIILYIPELLRNTECNCKIEVVVFVSFWYVSVFDANGKFIMAVLFISHWVSLGKAFEILTNKCTVFPGFTLIDVELLVIKMGATI